MTLEFSTKLMKRKALIFFLFLFSFTQTYAQSGDDFIRSTGKIYAVVAVVLVLFLGILWYLFRLDKKIKLLENHYNNE